MGPVSGENVQNSLFAGTIKSRFVRWNLVALIKAKMSNMQSERAKLFVFVVENEAEYDYH